MRFKFTKTSFLFAGVWVITVALAFFVGRQLSFDNGVKGVDFSDVAGVENEKLPSVEELIGEGSFSESEGLEYFGEELDTVHPGSVVPSLREALRVTDPVKRLQLLTLALEGLDSSNVHEALALLENRPRGFSQTHDLNLLMYSWGKFDGPAALDYAENDMRGRMARFATHSAMSGWAANDPQGALDWTVTNDSEGVEILGLVSGWASVDLAGAADYVIGLEEGPERSRAVGVVVNNYLQEGPDYAVAWANSLPEGDFKTGVVGNLSRQWANIDAPATAQWVTGYADTELGERAVPVVASQWAREDPAEAAAWASSLPEGSSKEKGLSAVANRWASTDPNAAGEWLNSLPPDPSLDSAVDSFARRISSDDPEGAVSWAESIIDPELRSDSVTKVGQEWYRQDPEAASQWVESSQLSAEVQAAILNPPPEIPNDRRGFFGRGQ